MAQTYTIEEASERLGIAADEFKRRLKDDWKSIRSFRDGPTLRFRAADIDELARTLGEASDPGLQLAAPGAAAKAAPADDFLMPPSDDEIPLGGDDIFTLASGSAAKPKPKTGSDSDVRLELAGKPKPNPDLDGLQPTEEIALDLSGPISGVIRSGNSSARLKAPRSGPNLAGPESSNRIPGPPPSDAAANSTDSSSEFELSLDADSGSFELQLNDGSDEVDIGGGPAAPAAGRGGQSGINLGRPADSGLSLEKNKKHDDESSDDFELSLDPSDDSLPALGRKISGPKSGKMPAMSGDSDSEFELTLDDNSGVTDGLAAELQADGDDKRDIFETDFELPVVSDDADSGSEVVALDSDTDIESSDFDLALSETDVPLVDDDSASQVVMMDDDEDAGGGGGRLAAGLAGAAVGAAAMGAARGRRGAAVADDDDAAGALQGVRRGDDDDDAVPAGAVAPPAKWGPLPAAVLLPCLIFAFLGSIMSFELMRGMTGYSQGKKPAAALVRGIAGLFDMDPKD